MLSDCEMISTALKVSFSAAVEFFNDFKARLVLSCDSFSLR